MIKRFDACVFLFFRNKEEPFLYRNITCDEKWILYDNRKYSASWLDKDEALKHRLKPKIHQKKPIVTAWWSSHGLIHKGMMKSLTEKQPRLVNRDRPILLHDNARIV